MNEKKILVLYVFCSLLVAFIWSASADNVQKCTDCVPRSNVSDKIHPNSPALYIKKENTSTTLIEQGGTIGFRLNVSNQGGKSAYDVVVRDIINVAGFEYVAGSHGVYGNEVMVNVPYSFATGSNNTVFEWTFLYVPAGALFYINFSLKAVNAPTTTDTNTSNDISTNCINNSAFVAGTYEPFQDCFQRCMENGLTHDDCQKECPHQIGFSGESDESERQNNQATWLGEDDAVECILVKNATTIVIKIDAKNATIIKPPKYTVENNPYDICVCEKAVHAVDNFTVWGFWLAQPCLCPKQDRTFWYEDVCTAEKAWGYYWAFTWHNLCVNFPKISTGNPWPMNTTQILELEGEKIEII